MAIGMERPQVEDRRAVRTRTSVERQHHPSELDTRPHPSLPGEIVLERNAAVDDRCDPAHLFPVSEPQRVG
jgi:hypothetical protein